MVAVANCWTLLAVSVLSCGAVHVTTQKDKAFAMLFQATVLPCHYSTTSTQVPVVQWWYKSYCSDRTRDSFTFPESLGVHVSDLGQNSHLDCSDTSRTVRIVASRMGASLTLAEHYKGRDISIINKADLRFGQLQWGDSGVYFCKVILADDLEGKNEAQVELLVMGRTDVLGDILPEFELEIMSEGLFVGLVVLASVLFLLLVGICWCQCCPHSCCCYLSCCCCPETCCCPRHLYMAGKMAKGAQPSPAAMYQPYYPPEIRAVPAPPASSVTEPKITTVALPLDNNVARVRSGYRLLRSQGQDSSMKVVYYIEKELAQFRPTKMSKQKSASMSELSSLHEGDGDFRHTYRQVQRKALPTITDLDDASHLRTVSSSRGHRPMRYPSSHTDEQLDSRCNPLSEQLQRRPFGSRGRTGSLDELEEFALSYGQRGRRGDFRDLGRGYDFEMKPHDHYPSYRDTVLPGYHDDEDDGWHRRRRLDTGESARRAARGHSYDDSYLNSVLERKAQGRGARTDEGSDTPSKGSSKRSGEYYSRSPSNRPEEDDPLPPYSEVERYRTAEPHRYRAADPGPRPFSYTRPVNGQGHTLPERDKGRKVSTQLSRDSLVV
ncbi:immunoglobulin-like domain-containing receptor 2 isoform X2 [Denticeps clupeoides]|uniref:LISCH7 domain-containing protein n=2 Tax=Denticeps clupeoides TaxID=299321 RepID=A0AAY4EH26_9TELE|nr:immunoglobulin-like domain-containing receptor 2 isoform X2 [Denticeps clupeoides]